MSPMPYTQAFAWESLDAFWGSVLRDRDGCWLWMGNRNNKGYGRIGIRNKNVLTTRYVMQMQGIEIPAGRIVMHRCDNPPCVNPEHLVIGTDSDNIRDALAKGRIAAAVKEHCKHGHPFSGDNLVIDRRGWRKCRTCIRATGRAGDARRRALTPRRNVGRAGLRGVCRNHHKWTAFVGGHSTRQYLGNFNTPEAAAKAYDRAARERYGALAVLNFPDEAAS